MVDVKRNLVFLLAVLSLGSATAAEEKLFNGKDLTGWSGDPRLWKVVNGVLVGEANGTDKKVAANTFLIWEGVLDDFDLKITARVTGGNNSGIQYRSRVLDKAKWSVGGYQMDLHPKPEYLGMLYEEQGRGIQCQRGQRVVLEKGAKPKVVGKLDMPKVDLAKFNDYAIAARGNRVYHFINGVLAAEIVDNDADKRRLKGALALQLHAGGPMKLEVKDISLRHKGAQEPGKEKPKKPTKVKKPKVVDVPPFWIWRSGGEPETETVYFRGAMGLTEADKAANLTITCDNKFRAYVNGELVGVGSDWSNPQTFEVRKHIKKGRNVIAVMAENEGTLAGLVAKLTVKTKDVTDKEGKVKEGKDVHFVTNGGWKWSKKAPEDWEKPEYDDSTWKPVKVLGKMGIDPWGHLFGGVKGVAGVAQAPENATDKFKVAEGFQLEKLYTVPKAQGSWVSMAVRNDGSLIVGDQYGGLYSVKPALGPNSLTEVEPLDLEIGGAHGLLWHKNALYVAVNERGRGTKKNGIYMVTDSDGDRELDTIETLKEVGGGGEHGLHSLVPSPDGEWIYFICGNHTNPPELDHYWMPRNWAEDHLLPRNPDGNGHASGTMAPGGTIWRFKPDGSRWEMVSNGFRNPFDMAFNQHGDLFAYDADMEWDLGMPWYRPTRINHVIRGSEWGWRNGTGKWPTYYEDSLPAVVDIGPGSPTGALSGLGARFPAKYQKAIYFFDWTFATIHAVHFHQEGASYRGTKEEFVAGPGLPLTDAQIGRDGAMYFMTGGRRTASALWRVRYVGEESTKPVKKDSEGSPLPELIDALGKASIADVAKELGSDDRWVRFVARVEAERRPIQELVGALGEGGTAWQRIVGALAVARQGKKEDRSIALKWLGALKWAELNKAQQLGLLRAYALVYSRTGAPNETEWKATYDQIDGAYPAKDDELNAELCRVLCYLQAPKVVERTLALMAAPKDTQWPDWAELATRNSGYGRAVLGMLRNTPPAQDIHYALCLRNVKGPWTEGQRRQLMEWYAAVRSRTGGNSYQKFIAKMEKDMLGNATEEERKLIKSWNLPQAPSVFDGLPVPKGPGKNYTVADVARIGADLSKADLKNGREMFKAALCFACHRVDGEGGSAGPDLSAVGGRFKAADLGEALIHPNKVISDQYKFDLFTKKDGSSVWGRMVNEKDDILIVASNPYDFTQTVEVPRAELKETKPSPVSPMPTGLINTLNEQELRDLLGYLLKK